eukprot:TRINITY_DN7277_c0_g1_i1.p1 TRINITY_DN7277_c0_g1~~TRINITY_DN7277_c0_g1_i1.p1  ORF type:complete len:384 (-),score=74.60 TRINITY_DN7277_c0_g1_i1:38-1189(-)
MFTRKQQWRRVKGARRRDWHQVSDSVVDTVQLEQLQQAKAAASGQSTPSHAVPQQLAKSSSWQPEPEPPTPARMSPEAIKSVSMTRSVSCSSLTSKRSLFNKPAPAAVPSEVVVTAPTQLAAPRNSIALRQHGAVGARSAARVGGSGGGVGGSAASLEASRTGRVASDSVQRAAARRPAGWQRRACSAEITGGVRAVAFDPRVQVVLIPKRDEINDFDRYRLWWSRDDYAKFRQVLIDWKTINADKISPTDNILSINLSDLDAEDDEPTPAPTPDTFDDSPFMESGTPSVHIPATRPQDPHTVAGAFQGGSSTVSFVTLRACPACVLCGKFSVLVRTRRELTSGHRARAHTPQHLVRRAGQPRTCSAPFRGTGPLLDSRTRTL